MTADKPEEATVMALCEPRGGVTAQLLHGDVLDVLPTLEADSFDAMLTDPPYHLTAGKRGGTGEASVNLSHPAGRARISTGFMGQRWDGGDIAFRPDVWRECLRVLKPGAFALVFGGTRTFHRLAVALEDAGFEMRDTLMWIYGSGFPKSKNLDGDWQGYGTSLKPAYEPVLLVRKPTPLTYAQNALEHGTGALNIDGARVPFLSKSDEAESKNKNRHADFGSAPRENRVYGEDGRSRAEGGNYDPPGRWPSNLIHDGSNEVVGLFPSTTSRGHTPARRGKGGISTGGHGGQEGVDEAHFDTGSAARFFYTAKASSKERNAGLAERNRHPTIKPLALTEYLAKLLLPPERDTPRRLLVPFAGSGSEMIGARQAGWDEVVGIEREAEYVAIAEARLAHWTKGIQLGLVCLEAV